VGEEMSMKHFARRLIVSSFGLASIFAIANVTSIGSAPAGAAAAAHTVALSCPYGDSRTQADASVKPGVIVPDYSGFPYSPPTYSAYTIDDGGHLQLIGASSALFTEDHLVAAWQNSTNCYGSSISRNAWVEDTSGTIFSESDFSGPPAYNFGDMAGRHLNQPMVGMSPTADANGYWMVASDGGIFAFGTAAFLGSMGGSHLNQPVVGMAVTPDGGGYWLVATDGGMFSFGDAQFFGSMGGQHLNKPIEAMTPTSDGRGYWMVASDGGVFCFGDAQFHGSTGNRTLSAPIAGMIPNGSGYTLIGQDGQEYPFS
jgi:hypothetical protein